MERFGTQWFEWGDAKFALCWMNGYTDEFWTDLYSVQFYADGDEKEAPDFARTFYYGNIERDARNFIERFMKDEEFRDSCLLGTERSGRLESWFDRNRSVYYSYCPWKIISPGHPSPLFARPSMQGRKLLIQEMERLYRELDSHLEELEALPEYQEHVRIDEATPRGWEQIDPEINEAVFELNALLKLDTVASCQGMRHRVQVPWWPHGPLWFPGRHRELAYVSFERTADAEVAELAAWLVEKHAGQLNDESGVESDQPENNAAFVDAILGYIRHKIGQRTDREFEEQKRCVYVWSHSRSDESFGPAAFLSRERMLASLGEFLRARMPQLMAVAESPGSESLVNEVFTGTLGDMVGYQLDTVLNRTVARLRVTPDMAIEAIRSREWYQQMWPVWERCEATD